MSGALNSPPEDCGGIRGYQGRYLPALADENHPEHEELLAWRGPYDPTAFDLAGISAALSAEFAPKVNRRKTLHLVKGS